ncbi:S8 family peptidase [Alkalicoccus halolimnae]|uniref:S8 family serine peptidase n=1 Tax=Alkalicoccus halolimnae TaxID=1667239 RepID=A0A5C7FKZ4_9BACI|nr:S8 family serine peptidase [Alkalicoccus halolimnae]TXF86984.1 S8 family serine peptidase [Alkalicoccus halolimnae]
MTNRTAFFIVIGILVTLLPGMFFSSASAAEQEYLVTFEEVVDESVIHNAGGDIKKVYENAGVALVSLTDDSAGKLSKNRDVTNIEADPPVFLSETDELEDYQFPVWGFNKIQLQHANRAGLTGKGVKVAVIDTGISTSHEDLNVKEGYNFLNYSSNYEDDHGHGSHVAGILAGSAPLQSDGMRGVAPGVDLYAAKVMDDQGSGRHSTIIEAIEWSIEKNVDIINLSIGGQRASEGLTKALAEAHAEGITMVGAAGNRGEETGITNIDYPARDKNVIGTAATNFKDERAPFSTAGSGVEIAAPGVSIYSASTGRGYEVNSGTSMAAPMVSGMLAIMKESDPELSSREMRLQLREWTAPSQVSTPNNNIGYGRIEFPRYLSETLDPVMAIKAEAAEITNEAADIKITWSDSRTNVTFELMRNGETIYKGQGKTYTERISKDGNYVYSIRVTNGESAISPEKKASELRLRLKDPGAQVLSRYPDLIENAWYIEELTPLVKDNLINGYTDGTFRPQRKITRAEVVELISREQNWEMQGTYNSFTDLSSSHFAYNSIREAASRGIVEGYTDNKVRPDQPITRAEVSVLLTRVYHYPGTGNGENFPDLEAGRYYYEQMKKLSDNGILRGYPNGSLQPGGEVTRAEFSAMLTRTRSIQ